MTIAVSWSLRLLLIMLLTHFTLLKGLTLRSGFKRLSVAATPGLQASPTRNHGYLISWATATSLWPLACWPWPLEICLVPWPRPRPWPWPWPWPRHNGLIPYGNGNGNGMVMVSITFASLSPGLQGYLRPAGFPHAHPAMSWAMAICLEAMAMPGVMA